MSKKKLETGDVIYCVGNYGPRSRDIIDRVTDSSAWSGNVRFKREASIDGRLTEVAADRWSIEEILTILNTPSKNEQ